MRLRSALLSLSVAVVGCIGSRPTPPHVAGSQESPSCSTRPFVETARFDEVYRKACHNCYEPSRSPSLSAALDRVRSIEIDFWDDHDLFGRSRPGAWYVRHGLTGGNKSNCSGNGDLAGCLGDVRMWSDAHPGHEVVTVYLDKKQGWGGGRRPADLDALLARVFPRERIFTPGELKGEHPTLRAAAESSAWPTMESLHDKVVFVITGGGIFQSNRAQHQYVEQRGESALAFVAPGVDDVDEVTGAPDHFDASTAQWVVFYNLDHNGGHLGRTIREKHHVARLWGTDEGAPIHLPSLAQCVNFVAHDRLDATAAELHGVLVPRARTTERATIEALAPRF